MIKMEFDYQMRLKIFQKADKKEISIAFFCKNRTYQFKINKRSCSQFREYYIKKRSEGKFYTEAVISTPTKLLRIIFTLLSEIGCFLNFSIFYFIIQLTPLTNFLTTHY